MNNVSLNPAFANNNGFRTIDNLPKFNLSEMSQQPSAVAPTSPDVAASQNAALNLFGQKQPIAEGTSTAAQKPGLANPEFHSWFPQPQPQPNPLAYTQFNGRPNSATDPFTFTAQVPAAMHWRNGPVQTTQHTMQEFNVLPFQASAINSHVSGSPAVGATATTWQFNDKLQGLVGPISTPQQLQMAAHHIADTANFYEYGIPGQFGRWGPTEFATGMHNAGRPDLANNPTFQIVATRSPFSDPSVVELSDIWALGVWTAGDGSISLSQLANAVDGASKFVPDWMKTPIAPRTVQSNVPPIVPSQSSWRSQPQPQQPQFPFWG